MTNLEWLLESDFVLKHLVNKYLLEKKSISNNKGLINKYLELIDKDTLKWGNGFYGPKWISTHYTLMELKYMEILPNTKIYCDSLINYVKHYWDGFVNIYGIESMDLCITGMIINLLSYGNLENKELYQMIDYVLATNMGDGGWNCCWNHNRKPHISSVHTTINVLEGLAEYKRKGYKYRIDEIKYVIDKGINSLLNRNLIFIKNKSEPIHPSMIQHHYPARWKYDYLRILEFLAKEHYPLCDQMAPALSILKNNLKNGRLTKGSTISGLIHFPLEQEKYGKFNTLRAYIVLKEYFPKLFNEYLAYEIIGY